MGGGVEISDQMCKDRGAVLEIPAFSSALSDSYSQNVAGIGPAPPIHSSSDISISLH